MSPASKIPQYCGINSTEWQQACRAVKNLTEQKASPEDVSIIKQAIGPESPFAGTLQSYVRGTVKSVPEAAKLVL